MAKVKKNRPPKKIKPKIVWQENKTEIARETEKPVAPRSNRFGTPTGVAVFLLIALSSLLLPKDQFQTNKEKVLRNPNDIETRLNLAEEFIKNNQLNEAEKELLTVSNKQQSVGKFEELWQKWQEENPTELKKLIEKREKFVSENPTYRDGYLKLTLYYFKLGNPDKAKENLQKAIALDPNFETSREIKKVLGGN